MAVSKHLMGPAKVRKQTFQRVHLMWKNLLEKLFSEITFKTFALFTAAAVLI